MTTAISGKATYRNRVTGEEYKLGFEIPEGETELGRAWDLCRSVANRKGWNPVDVAVRAGE
jgi:hypothetical protein